MWEKRDKRERGERKKGSKDELIIQSTIRN